MANKYLSTGTATWTNTSRTISGATLNTVFVSDDATYQRQVMFRIGATLYYGRVSTYVSGTSVTLLSGGSLPSADGTIAELFLFDLSESHSYQDYLDKIGTMIQDDASKISSADIGRMLAQAVSDYSSDKPLFVRKKITGNGTDTYVLTTEFGSLWKHGYSFIRGIEHPFDEDPPAFLESDEYFIYDDGTAQDGSNLSLRFDGYTPSATEYFVAEIRTPMSLPSTGTKNYPDTDEHFSNITLLAASYCCYVLAAAYAQSSDTTITADVVNYHDKTNKYTGLAKMYQRRYNINVFGSEEMTASIIAAAGDKDLDLAASTGNTFLFHGGRDR